MPHYDSPNFELYTPSDPRLKPYTRARTFHVFMTITSFVLLRQSLNCYYSFLSVFLEYQVVRYYTRYPGDLYINFFFSDLRPCEDGFWDGDLS